MKRPKVLVFDIETYGGLKAHMSEISMFGYKWYGEPGVTCINGYDFKKEFKKDFTNDKPLLTALSSVWNQADSVIAHYGERFDRRFLNSRIEKHGIEPLKPLILIDTWRISKDNFALPGNSLNTLLKYFNCPYQKVDLTYEEWRKVQLGDITALKKLSSHCKNDVLGLDWIMEEHLSHYTLKLPNWNMYVDPIKMVCPHCKSDELSQQGYRYSRTTVWKQYKCKNCRRWSHGPIKGKGVIR